MVLDGVTDSDYQGETELLLHNGGKKEYTWNAWWLNAMKNYKRPIQTGLMARPRMKIWVTPPSKEPQPAKAIVEGKGNMEWVVEEDSYNTIYNHMTSYRN